jgi:hypothetical protein
MGGDFSFVLHENPAPSHIDLTEATEKLPWQASADRWTYRNILHNALYCTQDMIIHAQTMVCQVVNTIKKTPTNPTSIEARAIVTHLNRQWLFSIAMDAF